MKSKYIFSLCFLWMLSGCYMPPSIQISSSRILKHDINTIKSVIIGESYSRYDEVDDVPHCVDYGSLKDCYFMTRYIKKLNKAEPKDRIFIMLSYKKYDSDSDYCKNLAINISENKGDDPILNAEFARMGDLIFKEVTKVSDGKVERRQD